MKKNSFSKLKKLLLFVYNNRYSDFYKIRFKKAGFNPLTDFKSIKDVKKIPFLSKTELLNADLSKLLFVNEKYVIHVKSTSGTTGKPLYVFYSRLDKIDKWMTKINFGRTLNLVNPINIDHHSFTVLETGFWPLNGDIHNLPATAKMAAEFQVKAIHTTVTLAIVLSDYLKDYPILIKSLKYLHLFGERVNLQKKKFLQKLYPKTTILLTYGTAETMIIASQCEYLAKRQDGIYFHPRFDYQCVEIINPDTGKEVKSGEKGEIVLTNLYLVATPIIRYKTGDLVSMKDEKKCPCGFPGPLLQIWGRVNNDLVKAGGFELRSEFLEKAIDKLNFLKGSFEAHIYESFVRNQPKIKVELNLALKEGVKESLVLKQKIENELLENWQVSARLKLKDAVKAGLFEPVKINFIDFPISVKTKKTLILHQI